MQLRIVPFTVKPDQTQAFESLTAAHVRESLREPGITRFELWKLEQDPTRYVLLIAFKDDAAREVHFALQHTPTWRNAVLPLLLEPISPMIYSSVNSPGA